jgi:hypothetical protein
MEFELEHGEYSSRLAHPYHRFPAYYPFLAQNVLSIGIVAEFH